jgi:rubrerythrin
MVSTVEKQMPPRHLQHCIEEEKENSEISSFHKVHQRILDEKLIIAVQICHHCGRKFSFKKGHRSCPYCQGLLRINTMILKVPQF